MSDDKIIAVLPGQGWMFRIVTEDSDGSRIETIEPVVAWFVFEDGHTHPVSTDSMGFVTIEADCVHGCRMTANITEIFHPDTHDIIKEQS